MKVMIKRSCGHEEKIKVYTGGTLKSEIIVGRESLKRCRNCGKNNISKKS